MPKTGTDFLPTGIVDLDHLLAGGIPRGRMTEIVGAHSSGRTSLLFLVLAQAIARQEMVAYIDVFDSLDPVFAEKAGVHLGRLLWVRCKTSLEKALKATDIIARAGSFGVVVLDLQPARGEILGKIRKIHLNCWFRLWRAIEGTPTVLLLLEQEALSGSASSLVISLHRRKTHWLKHLEQNKQSCPIRHTSLLRGIWSEVRLLRGHHHGHATFYSHFKP